MEERTLSSSAVKTTLPVILIASVVQGWTLYGLHHAITSKHWPATDNSWLMALYALATFIPITVELLAEHARKRIFWTILTAIAIGYFYFGWHFGSSVADSTLSRYVDSDWVFSLGFVSVVLWLLLLPFVQTRIETGRWTTYSALFAFAWRNKLALAEAVLFTGLFWLLLMLWQSLFHMLNINFFRDLFDEPIFVYPVTALAFGCALHLIGSIERLTSLVLEQLLNVLKWLAILAGVILTLFTLALASKLPELVFAGQKAIGATWLLWLVAVMVLLLNAAYRDGSVSAPYPRWIAQALRFAVPLTVIVAATAMYALILRARHYGLTVERVWAFVVAGAAFIYSTGYALSALGRERWLAGIARVNIIVAIALIIFIAAALTPLLSPYRLSANSQFRIAQQLPAAAEDEKHNGRSAYDYLRFDAGNYGRKKLEELAHLQNGVNASRIRELAAAALAKSQPYGPASPTDMAAALADLSIYPAGHAVDAALLTQLRSDMSDPSHGFVYARLKKDDMAGLYIDLSGDTQDEFLFLSRNGGLSYEKVAGQWKLRTRFHWVGFAQHWDTARRDLADGNVHAIVPEWKELSIGSYRFRVDEKEFQAD